MFLMLLCCLDGSAAEEWPEGDEQCGYYRHCSYHYEYILTTLNNSNVVIPSSYNYLHQANPNIGSASALAGVVLIVIAAVAIIVALFIAFRPFFGGGTV